MITAADKAIIRRIIDRRHVGEPLARVMRELSEMMRGGTRTQRAEALWVARKIHRENRRLYEAVMNGRFK